MTEELEKELRWSFPNIIPDSVCVDVEDGWYDLVRTACHVIKHEVEGGGPSAKASLSQVKEKFGTLRIYWDSDCIADTSHCAIAGAIMAVERMSSRTCEGCGNKGEIRTGGWLKCLCKPCRDLEGLA